MARKASELTNAEVKAAKPAQTPSKLVDGRGLYLLVTVSGAKLWRYDYRHLDRRKTLALGGFPDVSLADAREKHRQARELLAKGIDPGAARKAEKAERKAARANTFELLARAWHDQQDGVLIARTRDTILSRLERLAFPAIGDTPLDELTPRMILDRVLRPIEERGTIEMAHRTKGTISQVLRYGVAIGKCERDLTADLRGALKPIRREHFAALDEGGTPDPVKVGALLRALDGYDGNPVVKQAMRLHPLVAVRPGELRHAEWSEFDLDAAVWSIPAGKMKMKNAHLVPLAPQAVAILRELQPLTGGGKYLFPCTRTVERPISDGTMNAALRRLGYSTEEMTPHGWRAIFRTLADEVLQERVDFIEAQLGHAVKDPTGRAYNRTAYLKDRRELMNRWAKYLEGQKAGGRVIPITTKKGA